MKAIFVLALRKFNLLIEHTNIESNLMATFLCAVVMRGQEVSI